MISETYKFMYEVRENILCTPSMNCDYNDGFQLFQLQDIDNSSACEGYGEISLRYQPILSKEMIMN